jgi:DNA-binding HxlR family transcriptional regulator
MARDGETEGDGGEFCPLAVAVEVTGERWSMMILRDLLVGVTRFNDLARSLPGISRNLLTKRLRQFEAAGLVERLDGEYLLTPMGADLRDVVFGLGEWGARWMLAEGGEGDINPQAVMWWIHKKLDPSPLPDRRVVVRVDLDHDPQRFWLVFEGMGPSVCLFDPGYEADVYLRTDALTLFALWQGSPTLAEAVRAGSVRLDGPSALTRRLPEVFAHVGSTSAAVAPSVAE